MPLAFHNEDDVLTFSYEEFCEFLAANDDEDVLSIIRDLEEEDLKGTNNEMENWLLAQIEDMIVEQSVQLSRLYTL